MNGRMFGYPGNSPEARIAAVAKSLMVQMDRKFKREPDYADFRAAFKPFLEKEILLARIEEARNLGTRALSARMAVLALELVEVEKKISDDLCP